MYTEFTTKSFYSSEPFKVAILTKTITLVIETPNDFTSIRLDSGKQIDVLETYSEVIDKLKSN